MSPLCRAKNPKTISPAPEPPPQSQRLPEPSITATLHPRAPPPLSPRHSPASPRENDDKPSPLLLRQDEEPCAPNQPPCCCRRSRPPACLQKAPLSHCLPNLQPAKKERRDIHPQHPRPLSLNAAARAPLSPKIPRCIPRQKACLCPVRDYLTVNQPPLKGSPRSRAAIPPSANDKQESLPASYPRQR